LIEEKTSKENIEYRTMNVECRMSKEKPFENLRLVLRSGEVSYKNTGDRSNASDQPSVISEQ